MQIEMFSVLRLAFYSCVIMALVSPYSYEYLYYIYLKKNIYRIINELRNRKKVEGGGLSLGWTAVPTVLFFIQNEKKLSS
jgi:hypothetical protein